MPDSIDGLHAQILDKVFEWYDHVEAEIAADERRGETNVQHRAGAALNLQEIRTLAKQVRKREERAEPPPDDGRYFCSVHNSWHEKGLTCS